tara:strand:- start:4305 stop:4940 length:636 start_codon:yes stop_codon:yes gene_type:complete
MAANEHKNLTDVNRHNPKGFESANNDTLLSKTVGTGTANTDGSLQWVEKNQIKTESFDIQGYVTAANANYYFGANMTDGQSPNEYNQGYGASTIGNATLDVGDFFKVKSIIINNACTLKRIYLLANATTGASVTVALCKVTFVSGIEDPVTPVLLNELTIEGLSSNDKVVVTRNLTPESSLAAGDVLFAMVKCSLAATAFFKVGIEVGYDN